MTRKCVTEAIQNAIKYLFTPLFSWPRLPMSVMGNNDDIVHCYFIVAYNRVLVSKYDTEKISKRASCGIT
ncbi:MAG: hypothetical protein M1836_007464, partial [Candelina mexicana]